MAPEAREDGRTRRLRPDGLIEVEEGILIHPAETPEEISAAFAAMADDHAYQALSAQLDAEFAEASWEALELGEAALRESVRVEAPP